ncbi:MAG: YcxB family protein [Oscillospiraceae bacterium]|nr:YcxB family protein [Oscillospiraceae bacterium]
MEQTAFVSRRLYDKTALLSGLKRRPATASGRFYRAVLRLCAAVFFLCALVMAGCMLLAQNQAQTLLWLMNVVISLAAGLLFASTERLHTMRDWKTISGLQGSAELYYTMTFADEVSISLGRQKFSFPYDRFGQLTEDDDSFYLWLEKGLTYRIPKDTFVQGRAEEFAAFIRPRLGQLQNGTTGRRRVILALTYLLVTIIYLWHFCSFFF